MFAPPAAPAAPPPPPLSSSVRPPSGNKALLSSIEKGKVLKKVPDSAKNDRSAAQIGGSGNVGSGRSNSSSNNNSSSNKPINGIQPNPPGGNKGGPMKPFPDMQSELLSQISGRTANATRKQSVPMSSSFASLPNPLAPAPARPTSKKATPGPNQFPLNTNRPPPPPPTDKKPLAMAPSAPHNTVADSAREALKGPSNSKQPPVSKKVQPPIPSVVDGRPNSVVSRTTMAPPPPLPDITRDCPKPTAPKPQAPNMRQGYRDAPRSHSVQHNLPLKINSEGDLSKPLLRESPKLNMSANHFGSNPQREAPRAPPQLTQPPPPVPMRVTNQPGLSGPASLSSRPYSSSSVNQYKVADRLPPPPPPSNSSAQTNQRASNFDRRFTFPQERNFPSPSNVPNLR